MDSTKREIAIDRVGRHTVAIVDSPQDISSMSIFADWSLYTAVLSGLHSGYRTRIDANSLLGSNLLRGSLLELGRRSLTFQ